MTFYSSDKLARFLLFVELFRTYSLLMIKTSLMKHLTVIATLITLLTTSVQAQYSTVTTDSLSQPPTFTAAMQLKLEKPAIHLNMDVPQLLEQSRGFYIRSFNGTYEQYTITGTEATHLMAWKGHYPQPGFGMHWNGGVRYRDSYNPHGASSIGEALVNGVLNGLIFGNKY